MLVSGLRAKLRYPLRISFDGWVSISLFLLCFAVLLRTMARTFYALDSAELAAGAATLGIVHSPGYPLYLLLGHAFTWIPVGDIGFRVNLLSVFSLALTVPLLFGLLRELGITRWSAFASVLVFAWSYRVWSTGVTAEVYAPQLFCLAAFGWALAATRRTQKRTLKIFLPVALLYGLAVAMNPPSVLLAPGLVVAFLFLRAPWRLCIVSAAIALAVFLLSLLYFPLRYTDSALALLAGQYGADGVLRSFDLGTPQGVLWFVTGQQFGNLFFRDGFLPSGQRIADAFLLLWNNYLGFGFVIALFGVTQVWRQSRKLMVVWLAFFLPYVYFYMNYGANDRYTMYGPACLLGAILLAYGLDWFVGKAPAFIQGIVAVGLPLVFLIANLPLLDISHDTRVRDRAERIAEVLPINAVTFGDWWDIIPLQYLQFVEHRRTDLRLYNLFSFQQTPLDLYLVVLEKGSRIPVAVVSDEAQRIPIAAFIQNPRYTISFISVELPSSIVQSQETPSRIVILEPRK